jgi:hypothetical protein
VSLTSALLTVVAIALTYRTIRLALRHPRVPVFLVCGLLMCAPVTLLQAAHLTRFFTVLPLLLLLGFSGWKCAVGVVDRYAELRGAPRELNVAPGATGWWNAPAVVETSVEGDLDASDGGSDTSNNQFDELIRRNFTPE